MSKKYPLLIILLLLHVSTSLQAQKPDAVKTLIEKYFKKVDSLFIVISNEPELRMMEMQPTDSLFARLLKKHSFIHALSRTNSRGVLVNKAKSGVEPTERYSDISEEEWYKNPAQTSKPYYSPITTVDKKIAFIWSKPLFIKRSNGENRFGGVVAAQIDIREILNKIAKRYTGPAQCLYKNRVFFQFSWRKTGDIKEQPVVIKGRKAFIVQTAIIDSKKKQNERGLKDSSISKQPALKHEKSKPVKKAERSKKRTPLPSSSKSIKKASTPFKAKGTIIAIIALAFVIIIIIVLRLTFRSKEEPDSDDTENDVERDCVH